MAKRKRRKTNKRVTERTSSPESLIKKNLTSFVVGLSVVAVLLLGTIIYLVSTYKNLIPSNISDVFKREGENMKLTDDSEKYTVQEGDDLCTIAQEKYGDCNLGYEIARANNLTNPDQIEKGQELKLPDLKPTGEVSSTQSAQVTISGNEYVVKAGDSLWSIAAGAYGDPYMWPKIAAANNITNPDLIYADTKLTLPR